MTTQTEVMKLALEALELEDMACRYEKEPTPEHIAIAITALREALAQQPARTLEELYALSREVSAEQPAQQEEPIAFIDMSQWPPIRWRDGMIRKDVARFDGQGLVLSTSLPAQQEPTKVAVLVDALIAKYSDKLYDGVGPHDAAKFEEDCNHIKQTLAEQPAPVQQEPVAWRLWDEDPMGGTDHRWVYYDKSDFATGVDPTKHFKVEPLYTSPQPAQRTDDTKRLDALAENSWDLRCFDMPTGADDADIGWRVVEHHMAKPNERTVAEVFRDDPRQAIDAAIAAANDIKRDA